MEAYALLGAQRGRDLEERPAVARQHLMRHPFADRRERLAGGLGAADNVGRDLGQDALPAVALDDRPQHAVAIDEAAQRDLEAVDVEAGGIDLEVEVGGDRAQLQAGAASDPVGLLDIGERERQMASRRVRCEPRQSVRNRLLLDPCGGCGGHPCHRGGGEEGAQRQLDTELAAHPV